MSLLRIPFRHPFASAAGISLLFKCKSRESGEIGSEDLVDRTFVSSFVFFCVFYPSGFPITFNFRTVPVGVCVCLLHFALRIFIKPNFPVHFKLLQPLVYASV